MKSCKNCDNFRPLGFTEEFGKCYLDDTLVKIDDKVCSAYSEKESKIDKLLDRYNRDFQ